MLNSTCREREIRVDASPVAGQLQRCSEFLSQLEMDHEEPHTSEPTQERFSSWGSLVHWWCDPRQWLRTILRLEDDPHSIALGTAIGMFIGLTPTFGIQMLLVLLIGLSTRRLFRFNQFAALVAVYVSNPLTMIPIFWFNYRVGAIFMDAEISWSEFVHLFEYHGISNWWSTFVHALGTLGAPLVVGSLLVATFFSLPTYPLMLRLIREVREHREHVRLKRQAVAEHDQNLVS